MLSVQQAESIILDLVQPLDGQLDTEVVSLDAAGRILAAPVTSQLDFPHWDNSAMDGYAVRCADIESCNEQQPAILEVVEEIPAGIEPQHSLHPGQAARIFTGGVMPAGADAVVPQENTRGDQNRVLVSTPTELGAFVRQRASFYCAGTPLLMPGIVLSAPEIALLAAAQCTQVSVYRRVKVAILSTGNELVTPDKTLQPGQIVDSNQYALATFVAENGGLPLPVGIVPDKPESLQEAIAQAISSADVVLSTGGVSVGDYDYVDQILTQLGGEIAIRAVAVKPGKPLTVATFPSDEAKKSCLYFGIPGNPVSALVSCWRFVQPALKKLSGRSGTWKPRFVKARTRDELHATGKRETYLWGQLQAVDGNYEFQLNPGSHSSGNLVNLAQTNALAVVPVGQTVISAGEEVDVMQISCPL
ncbi:MAG: molybdopterin molybdenumtransferase [Cyanobacteria bacterium QS_4_48_99]|nr:MAG: molybdopterin molybdenumtransferase [Cyanobacteria bacterium QS_4_48_99]